jgi:hypothetical protein
MKQIIVFCMLMIAVVCASGRMLKKKPQNERLQDFMRIPWQPTRFRVTNNCKFPLFVETRATLELPGADARFMTGAPVPNFNASTKIEAGQTFDYNIPDEGLAGFRSWAKFGCDNNHENCSIGSSMQKWDPIKRSAIGGCPHGGCHVAVDRYLTGRIPVLSLVVCHLVKNLHKHIPMDFLNQKLLELSTTKSILYLQQ